MIKDQIEAKKKGFEPIKFNNKPKIGVETPQHAPVKASTSNKSELSQISAEDMRNIIDKER